MRHLEPIKASCGWKRWNPSWNGGGGGGGGGRGASNWTMFATSQSNGAAATLLPPTAPGELAAFDVTPLLKGSPLQVTRRYIADPATQATLGDILVQHRVMLPSSSKYAVEVGSVEIAMIFDQLFTVRACLRVLFTSINLRQYLLSELHVRTRARSMGIRLNNYVPTYSMTSHTWTPSPPKKGEEPCRDWSRVFFR